MPPQREILFLDDLAGEIADRCGAMPIRLVNGLLMPATAPSGFGLILVACPSGYRLYLDGWMEELWSEEVVRRLVLDAVLGRARLRIDSVAGRRWRWTLECLDASGRWSPESTLSHVVWQLWGTRKTTFLVNSYRASVLAARA